MLVCPKKRTILKKLHTVLWRSIKKGFGSKPFVCFDLLSECRQFSVFQIFYSLVCLFMIVQWNPSFSLKIEPMRSLRSETQWATTNPLGIFLPESTFSAVSLTVSVPPPPTPCAITPINTSAHIKDPVVNVRVGWIMETLKNTACTVVWGSTTLLQLAF